MNLLKKLLVLLIVLVTIFPEIARAITIQEEEELSREFMAAVYEHYELIYDSIITDYVTQIGNKILAVMPPQSFPYRFHVIKEYTYNAFAGPGGQIFINSGLFEALNSEDEIAGIIAHEISHVACRHVSERIERSKKIGLATLAGVAAGILMGAAGSGAAASAATVGSMAGAQTASLAYSREDETQADQRGLDYLVKAGYNPKGLLSALTKIRSKQWYGRDQVPTYMMTPPAVEDRITFIGSWIEANPSIIRQLPHHSPEAFDWTHARLVAMFGPEEETLKNFKAQVAQAPDKALPHYGYGLILTRTGNRTTAIEQYRAALTKRAFDPTLLIELGRTYFLDGRYAEALPVLKGALDISPDETEGIFYTGRCLMEMGQFQEAARFLESLLRSTPDYPEALFALGSTYGSLGRTSDACYYLGCYYHLRGDYKNAIVQFEKAVDTTTDPEKKSEIEILLKDSKKRYTLLTRQIETRRR
jgi:beta-barrel assembly-enhancing protease